MSSVMQNEAWCSQPSPAVLTTAKHCCLMPQVMFVGIVRLNVNGATVHCPKPPELYSMFTRLPLAQVLSANGESTSLPPCSNGLSRAASKTCPRFQICVPVFKTFGWTVKVVPLLTSIVLFRLGLSTVR